MPNLELEQSPNHSSKFEVTQQLYLLSSRRSKFQVRLSENERPCMGFYNSKLSPKVETSLYNDSELIFELTARNLETRNTARRDSNIYLARSSAINQDQNNPKSNLEGINSMHHERNAREIERSIRPFKGDLGDSKNASLEIACRVDLVETKEIGMTSMFSLGCKTLIYNATPDKIVLFQERSYPLRIAPRARRRLYMYKGKACRNKNFYIQMARGQVIFTTTVPVNLDMYGTITVYMANSDMSEFLILKVSIGPKEGFKCVSIEERTGQGDMIFKNNLGMTLMVYQKGHKKSRKFMLFPGEQDEFSWSDPYSDKELIINIHQTPARSREFVQTLRKKMKPFNKNQFPSLTYRRKERRKMTDGEYDTHKQDETVKEQLGIDDFYVSLFAKRKILKLRTAVDQVTVKVEKLSERKLTTSKNKKIVMEVKLQGTSRQILLQTKGRDRRQKVDREIRELMNSGSVFSMFFNLSKLGVSLVGPGLGSRKELLYFYLQEVDLFGQKDPQALTGQIQIQYLNLDNNLSQDIDFPVILTTQEPMTVLKAQNRFALNFFFKLRIDAGFNPFKTPEIDQSAHIHLNKSKLHKKEEIVLSFDEIVIEVSPLNLVLDSTTLICLDKVLRPFMSIFRDLSRVGRKWHSSVENNPYLSPIPGEESVDLSPGVLVYCKNFSVSLLKAILTYRAVTIEDGAGMDPSPMIKTVTSNLISVEESPIKFTGIELFYVFESGQGLLAVYGHHLTQQWKMNMLRLLGSLNMLGNPTNLFGNLGNGVVQFFEKPAKGFKRGPIGAVKGGVQGSKALIKNTTVGVMSSVSKLTGSLASGLSKLSSDKEYEINRNKNKPKNTLEGVRNGAQSIGKGLWSGATGIFTQPVKGAKKSGAGGFFKGVFKGIAGVVTKPISGIMDAASQTTQGVSGSLTSSDMKPNDKRIRPTRIMYSQSRLIRLYDYQGAAIYLRAQKTYKGLTRSHLVSYHFLQLKSKSMKEIILVVTGTELVIFTKNLKKKLLSLPLRDIMNFEADLTTGDPEKSEMSLFYLFNKKNKVAHLVGNRNFLFKLMRSILLTKYFGE